MNTFSENLAELLVERGLTQVFAVPGGGNMFLLSALDSHPSIQIQYCHHEQAAAVATEAFFKVAGKPAVCLVTSGPGGTNAITGLAGAYLDSTPMLLLAGQVKTTDLRDSGLRQKGPQEVDLVRIAEPVCSKALQLTSPDFGPVLDLLATLDAARGGPVVLVVPLDIQNSVSKAWELDTVTPSQNQESTEFEAIWAALNNARRPVVLIGNGCRQVDQEKLGDFFTYMEMHDIAALFSWLSYDLMPASCPINLGRPGSVALRQANFVLQTADFVLVLGSRIDMTQTAFNPEQFGKNADVFVVDVDRAELSKHPDRFHSIVSDVAPVVSFLGARLNDSLGGAGRPMWRQFFTELREHWSTEDPGADNGSGLRIEPVVDRLSRDLPEAAVIVTGSSGLAVEIFHLRFQNKDRQRIFLTTALGSMGFGLPALVGAMVAENKSRPIFLFESDGSFMMNIQELSTIQALQKKAVIFLINNDGYASIRASQSNHFGKTMGTDSTSGLEFPDFEKIASAWGLEYFGVRSVNDLSAALHASWRTSQSCLINIQVRSDSKLLPKCAAQISGNNFGSSELEYMEPKLNAQYVEEILARGQAI